MRSRRSTLLRLLLPVVLVLASLTWTAENAKVIRVVDGDTLVVEIGGKTERVRLSGVDTPETVHPKKPVGYFGTEASAFTKRLANHCRSIPWRPSAPARVVRLF